MGIGYNKRTEYSTDKRPEVDMIIAKQMDIRSNIKEYFDLAYDGEAIVVPRKQGKNVVIISEERYNSLSQIERMETYAGAVSQMESGRGAVGQRAQIPEDNSAGSIQPVDVRTDNLRKLKSIAALKDGWNGNGAEAIPGEVIRQAEKLIKCMPVQPEIFPTALQTIQFEYDNARRDHIEIEIDGSDTADIFEVTYFGQEREEAISADPDSICERVMKFYG